MGTAAVDGDFRIQTPFRAAAEVDVSGVPTAAPHPLGCAGYALGSGGAASFAAPEIEKHGDPSLYVRATIDRGYTGPGTYTTGTSAGLQGIATVGLGSSVGQVFNVYLSQKGGTTTLVVRADGSGMLSFQNWGSSENRAQYVAGFLSGMASWSCQ